MRSLKVIGSAVAAALVLASSASAVSWDPQNTVVHGHGVNLTLTSGSGIVQCTITLNTKASGAVATTTDAAGNPAGPTFSGCSNNLGLSPTTVTSSSAWTATATSVTSVDVTNGNAVINIGSGACILTASAVSVPNNTWSNSTHTLTASSSTSFPLTRTGFCPLTASTGTMSGGVVFPASAVITP